MKVTRVKQTQKGTGKKNTNQVQSIKRLRSVVTSQAVETKWGSGRGNLYAVPGKDGNVLQLDMVVNRVREANNLYNVFFTSDIPKDLEEHFKRIVGITAKAETSKNLSRKLQKYEGYFYDKDSDSYKKAIDRFSYTVSAKKKLESVLALHVKERMTDVWRDKDASNAVVQVLKCICDGKNYKTNISKLSSDTLTVFWETCRSKKCEKNDQGYPIVYVPDSSKLEKCFTAIMKGMVKKCEQSGSGTNPYYAGKKDGKEEQISSLIETQISWLRNISWTFIGGVKTDLKDITFPNADKERMKAILVRMRRSLKKESNGEIAILLLQELASGKEKPFASLIGKIKKDPKEYEKLQRFVGAVNRDYYKADIIRSINRMDVKVQPREETISPDGREEKEKGKQLLALSNAGHHKKAALNETLLRYASSEEEANQTLLDIKALLFEYFLPEYKYHKETFMLASQLWKFPQNEFILFDSQFQVEDNNRQQGSRTLEDMFHADRPKQSEVKNRIHYVNCGKYQQCVKKEPENAFRKFWLGYMEDYVEKYCQKDRRLNEADCAATRMMVSCWKAAIQYLCGKYIDIGKAVYHFAMPPELAKKTEKPIRPACDKYGDIRREFAEGISSFDYEQIKAEETLQRDVSNAVVAAVSAFSGSVIDDAKRDVLEEKYAKLSEEGKEKVVAKLEDILLIGNEDLRGIQKPNARKQLMRFYGGNSTVPETFWAEPDAEWNFILELKQHFSSIRNENFHYTTGRHDSVETEFALKLWENDRKAYADIVRKRYYSNNVAMFYDEKQIANLVRNLYGQTVVAEAQIPAFRSIWKRSDLPAFIDNEIKPVGEDFRNDKDKAKRVIYEGALYFVLKEIYYHDFIVSEAAKEMLSRVNEDFKGSGGQGGSAKEKRAREEAEKDFRGFITGLLASDKQLTFGGICQAVQQEYIRQNAYQTDKEIYKHFMMLFPAYVREAFILYIREKYSYLLKPCDNGSSISDVYLEEVSVLRQITEEEREKQREYAAWYTFAHFLHPRQLNLLVGDLKSYIQYRSDIVKREGYAGQFKKDAQKKKQAENALAESVDHAKNILDVLEFVRGVSGRVSSEFEDYYESRDAYAEYLKQYIDFPGKEGKSAFESLVYFCKNTLEDGAVVDIYADEKNPKILRNVEIARMYAGDELPVKDRSGNEIRNKVTAENIVDYYKNKDKVAKILSGGLCKNENERKEVTQQQQLKNRLMLNDVTDIYAILNDLLGQLISMAYLRERDEMYLYLGFYYMALQSGEGWAGECLNQMEAGAKGSITKGLVLYQVVAAYDFGIPMPYPDEKRWKWLGGQIGLKYYRFSKVHKESFECARRLFGEDHSLDCAVALRDYVDHAKYYARHDKSVMDLYSEFYNLFFPYSRKLRNSIVHNFQSVLERYFVECDLDCVWETNAAGLKLNELRSTEFTYKLKDSKKMCTCKARNDEFIRELKAVLEYKV